jgi:hypothetical protein
MDGLLASELEAHPGGATLYLSGALSVLGALRAFGNCQALPVDVRSLRVDMRGVALFDPRALDVAASLLREWRLGRAGVTRVELPRERTFVSLGGGPVGLRSPFRYRARRALESEVVGPPAAAADVWLVSPRAADVLARSLRRPADADCALP